MEHLLWSSGFCAATEMLKTRSLLSERLAGDEDCPASQLSFPGEVLIEVMVGSCENIEKGSKLTLEAQGKVSSEMISETYHGGGGRGRQGDKERSRVLGREHSMCKGPGTGNSILYLFVGAPRCSVLLEHGTKC